MNIKSEVQGAFGANCYMVSTEKAALLIDASEFSDEVRTFLEENRKKEILILATHRHVDHVAGLFEARRYSAADVAIHREDACGLSDTDQSLATTFGIWQNPFTADRLLEDGDVLKVGDLTVSVLHTPGHTDGSVCFIVENMLFSGDTLFYLSIGRTDFPTGSIDKMQKSLRKLFSLDRDYMVYPGHGEITTLYYEKKYNPYYKEEK